MDIKAALSEIHVSSLKRLAAEAPLIGGLEIAAAYIYEARELGEGHYEARIVAVLEEGGLLLVSWADQDYRVTRVPSRNIANVSFHGSVATTREWSERYYWSEPRLVVELFSPLEGQQSLEFRALPRKQGELGSKVYDDKIESANAFKAVAEALSARLG